MNAWPEFDSTAVALEALERLGAPGPCLTQKQRRQVRLAILQSMARTLGLGHEALTKFASQVVNDEQLLSIARAYRVVVIDGAVSK